MNKTTEKLNIPKESVIFFSNISIARKKSSFQGVFCR